MKKLLDLKLEQELGILNFEKGFKFFPVIIYIYTYICGMLHTYLLIKIAKGFFILLSCYY